MAICFPPSIICHLALVMNPAVILPGRLCRDGRTCRNTDLLVSGTDFWLWKHQNPKTWKLEWFLSQMCNFTEILNSSVIHFRHLKNIKKTQICSFQGRISVWSVYIWKSSSPLFSGLLWLDLTVVWVDRWLWSADQLINNHLWWWGDSCQSLTCLSVCGSCFPAAEMKTQCVFVNKSDLSRGVLTAV